MDWRGTLSALPRWQKWAIGAAVAVALYAAFGFLAAPRIVHAQAEAALRETFDREARIGEVRINPFLLTLHVSDFALPDGDGSPFLRFDELGVDFELSSLFRRAFTFAEIRVVAPFVHVKILRDGSLNFASLLEAAGDDAPEPSEAPDEDTGPPPVLVHLAAIERGRIVFSDFSRPTPFEHEIAPLDVALRDFGTRPDDQSPYSFSATTGAGEALQWEGNLTVVPLASTGRFALTGLRPRTGWLYVQDDVHFEIVDGTVDVRGDYVLDAAEGLRVRLENGEIHVRDVSIVDRDSGDEAVGIPEIDVDGIAVDYPEQAVRIDAITSRGGRYHLVRLPDGRFRAEELVRPRSTASAGAGATIAEAEAGAGADVGDAAAPTTGSDATPPWTVVVDRIELTGHRLELDDRSTTPPAALAVEVVALGLTGVTSDPTRPVDATLELAIGDTGRLGVAGPVLGSPPGVDWNVTLRDLDLRPFEPYWAPFLAIDLTSGRVGLEGRLVARGEPDGEPRLAYTGDFRIDDLRTLDQLLSTDLVSWTALELDDLALTVEPTTVRLARLALQGPAAHLVLAPDGTANLATLVVSDETGDESAGGAAAAPEASGGGAPVPISIAVVEIRDGVLDFEDRTISPRFSTGISALGGRVEGLSSDASARATVALAGRLDGATPMRVDGVVSPLAEETYLDLRVAFENFGLPPFTPYSGRYIGKAIERGKLFVDLSYSLDGPLLVGENKVFLDQFTLGEDVDSPDATNLPVGLAIALLKDRNGEIHIDLPVRGRVDDPEFSVGGLVLGAVRNLITKVAMSPFAMLGGLAGSDGDDLRTVAFAPGRADLSPGEADKLGTLAGALAERPALAVELTGEATVEVDRPALQAAALDAQLRRARFQELQSKWFGDKPASVDEVVLLPEDRRRLVEKAFEARFDVDPDDLLAVPVTVATGGDATPPDPEAIRAAREAEMARRLREAIDVDPVALRDLARRRADAIRDRLVEAGGVEPARIYVRDPDVHEKAVAEGVGASVSLAAR